MYILHSYSHNTRVKTEMETAFVSRLYLLVAIKSLAKRATGVEINHLPTTY